MKCLSVSEWKQALNPKGGSACFSSSQIPRVVVLNYIFAVLREGMERKLATVNSWAHSFHQCKMSNHNKNQVALDTHRT